VRDNNSSWCLSCSKWVSIYCKKRKTWTRVINWPSLDDCTWISNNHQIKT